MSHAEKIEQIKKQILETIGSYKKGSERKVYGV